MPLTDAKIRSAKPAAKPYKLYDMNGLFMLIKPNGSKLWRMKYHYLHKERLCALGSYPDLKLKDVREECMKLKKQLSQGIDPVQQRRTTIHQRMAASENTFEALARRWFEIKNIDDRHRERSLRRLEMHAFPRLGFRPIHEISTVEIVSCLEAIERKDVSETAHRVKQMVQQVFRYAIRKGLIQHNPAGDLRDVIGHTPVQNRACIPPSELPALLKSMKNYHGSDVTRTAMWMLAYTFVRTGELRAALWDEIDWARAEWHIPAERMKMRRDHVVPLARQTLALLQELRTKTGKQPHIFHMGGNKSKHLSECAVLSALKRMGYRGRMTGHGFRALASTILNEHHVYNADVIEKQLAHADRNEVRAAYNRADYMLERKKMMQDWADYLDRVLTGVDNVIRGNFAEGKPAASPEIEAAE